MLDVHILKGVTMFTNFLKVTLRTLYREKVYAIINIAGLSIAIACCLILGLWLRSELTYDLHHKKHKQIYRVESDYIFDGSSTRTAENFGTPGNLSSVQFDSDSSLIREEGIVYRGVFLAHLDQFFLFPF